uniref:M23 family metallopeptidase n=1 Tax=Kocuria rhizophila TaxID=72000 RepID=UPI000A8C6D8E
MKLIVDAALSGESTSRGPGRRALNAVPDATENSDTQQHGGRRYVAGQRYVAAPETATIAATEIPSATAARSLARGADTVKRDNVLKSAPRIQRSRLGFMHKLGAVAAMSGLTVAGLAFAAPVQEAEGTIPEPQRVAQTSVADVSAPASDKLTVDRAAVTSEYIEIKKANPAPVTIAAEKKATKEAKPESISAAAGGAVTKTPAVGTLAQPVDSIRLTSRFGHRKNPTGPGYMIHNGLDYAVPMGTPVKASASGTVVQSQFAGHSGFRVEIDHGNGLHTSYN